MITLVKSRFRNERPDILILEAFEEFCIRQSNWIPVQGPVLFNPAKISTRFYALCHTLSRPALRLIKRRGAILSLGLPYRHYLFGKTFPYFALEYEVRALWSWDVWEPRFGEFERLVREARINLLMLSSFQATKYFRSLRIPECEVHWVPESIDPAGYVAKPWPERSVDILAFGRPHLAYHARIGDACKARGINYVFQPGYPSWLDFARGLADSKLCVCFPQAITHPNKAGKISTLTVRYLQAMAAGCLVIGSAPLDAQKLLQYNPVIEVDWSDPVGQIEMLLADVNPYQSLIERNFSEVNGRFHSRRFVARVDCLVKRKLKI